LLSHISTSDLLIVAFLISLILIVVVAAYLDFGTLKSLRIELGSRPSREQLLMRSRSKIL
jgi:hypothetical protein